MILPRTGFLAFSALSVYFVFSLQLSSAYGQSFLEKLESAVRQRLNDPNQPINEETIPAPNSEQGAKTEPGGSSILDSTRASETTIVPPPVEPPTATTTQVPSSERIYLGLEAEEVVGGGIGVRVTSVTQGSPAWNAGFEVGDRIAAVNGFAIANLDGMVEQLGKTAPGQTVKFLVTRAERNFELVAVLTEAGLAERIAGRPLPLGDLNGPAWLGLMVNDLTQSFRSQFGIAAFRGAAVTNVAADSPAAKVGIRAGDAVLAIGGNSIETSRDLMNWMNTARPGQQIDITFQRGTLTHNATLILEVTPENRASRTAKRNSTAQPSPAPAIELTPSRAANGTPQPNPPTIEELQNEILRLNSELTKANQRLETMQNRLQQILEGLGQK